MPTASSKSTPVTEPAAGARSGQRLPRLFPAELFLIAAPAREGVLSLLGELESHLSRPQPARLQDLALSASRSYAPGLECVAIVASSHADLRAKIRIAKKGLADPACARIQDKDGVYYFRDKLGGGKLAFMFPGENAQYVNMLADLCVNFEEVRDAFDEADAACSQAGDDFLPSAVNFPPPGGAAAPSGREEIAHWEKAVILVHTANTAMSRLTRGLELRPDAVLGHSFGELSAMEMAGVLRPEDRVRYGLDAYLHVRELSQERDLPRGRLLTVGGAERAQLDQLLARFPGSLTIAMENCPHQYVLCAAGPDMDAVIGEAERWLMSEGAICAQLPIERPYHTRFFEPAFPLERAYYERVGVHAPEIEVYSCATAEPFPHDTEGIIEVSARHWMSPVRFETTIRNLHDRGFRVFVDVGPRGNLCAFVGDILSGRPHLTVALNRVQRPAVLQLLHALGILAAHGVPLRNDFLHERWGSRLVDLRHDAPAATGRKGVGPTPLPILLPRMKADGIVLRLPEPARAPRAQSAPEAPRPEPAPERRPGPVERLAAPAAAPAAGSSPAAPPVAPAPAFEAAGLPAASGDVAAVMLSYMETMERFLAVQGEIVGALLGTSVPAAGGEARAAAETTPRDYPLLGRVLKHVPGESLVTQRVFDVEEDLYLNDHSFGTTPSTTDPGLRALPVMPLLLSLEAVAEAGAALFPAQKVVAVTEIRANRWIFFDEGKVTLRVEAHRVAAAAGGPQVRVAIFQEEANGVPVQTPMVEATAVLAHDYPPPPRARARSLPPSIPVDWTGAEIYPRRTFHGPLFQGIRRVTRLAEEGLDAQLEVLARDGLFRTQPEPRLIYDPVLADSLGQTVWLWGSKEPFNGVAYLPFEAEALRFYGTPLPPGTRLDMTLRVRKHSDGIVVVDLDAVDAAGNVQLSMEGVTDREFPISSPLHRMLFEPLAHTFADVREFDLPSPGGGAARISFASVAGFPTGVLEGSFGVWRKALAFVTLSPPERSEWKGMKVPVRREVQWLLGRAAAKDAVRHRLEQQGGRRLAAADILIGSDPSGRPFVAGGWRTELPSAPQVSISHTDGMVVAVAATLAPGSGIGVDAEKIRVPNPDFLEGAFAGTELALLPGGEAERLEWIFRCWSAKEAVGKALGSGVPVDPRQLAVTAIEPASGRVVLRFREGAKAGAGPAPAGDLSAVTFRKQDHAFAIATTARQG